MSAQWRRKGMLLVGSKELLEMIKTEKSSQHEHTKCRRGHNLWGNMWRNFHDFNKHCIAIGRCSFSILLYTIITRLFLCIFIGCCTWPLEDRHRAYVTTTSAHIIGVVFVFSCNFYFIKQIDSIFAVTVQCWILDAQKTSWQRGKNISESLDFVSWATFCSYTMRCDIICASITKQTIAK